MGTKRKLKPFAHIVVRSASSWVNSSSVDCICGTSNPKVRYVVTDLQGGAKMADPQDHALTCPNAKRILFTEHNPPFTANMSFWVCCSQVGFTKSEKELIEEKKALQLQLRVLLVIAASAVGAALWLAFK